MMQKFQFFNSTGVGVNNHRFNVAIRNSVDGAPLELHFLDLIYDTATYDWYYGYTETNMVEDVINKVKEAKPSRIKLIIDSEGGDAGIGIAIHNFLKNYNATIEVDIIGMAGSIASVLAFSASKGKLSIARNAFMVIHKAWGGGWGNSEDLRAAADVIDKYTAQIVDIYAQRTGKTSEEIAALIENGDYWMSGTEAIDLGFADNFLEENGQFQIAARIQSLDAHYKNVPQNLIQSTETTEEQENNEEEETESTTGNIANSQINNFMKKLSDLVQNAINSIKGKPLNVTTPDGATDIAAEVANHVEAPLTALLTAVDEEVSARMDAMNTRMDALEAANAKLLKDNEDLAREAADNDGGETTETPSNEKKGFAASATIKKRSN